MNHCDLVFPTRNSRSSFTGKIFTKSSSWKNRSPHLYKKWMSTGDPFSETDAKEYEDLLLRDIPIHIIQFLKDT